MKDLISTADLSKEEVEKIILTARAFKEGKIPSLRGDVALLFLEPSTRTRVSFEKACRMLGLNTYTVTGESSSMKKGESFYDTLKTFEAMGFSGVIFRVPFVLFPYRDLSESMKLSLVNAGDGTHQHPTQGLIDLYTLLDKLETLEGLKVLFVGDIAYSRVFRSTAPLLTSFGAEVSVCGPRTLIPQDVHIFKVVKVFDSVDEGIEWADVVMWLRIQRERQEEGLTLPEESYFRQFGLTEERYKRIKKFFLHPGPVNRYVDIDGRLIYSEKSLIYEQVKNGVFVRASVLYHLLNGS